MWSAAAAKSLQSCPTLCDPIDSSPPGSPIPGILQARTLEWVAISLSKAWKWKVKEVTQSCPTLHNPMDCSPPGSAIYGIFQVRVLEWGAITFSEWCGQWSLNMITYNSSFLWTLRLLLPARGGMAFDLLWQMECDRSDTVSVPGPELKRLDKILLSWNSFAML